MCGAGCLAINYQSLYAQVLAAVNLPRKDKPWLPLPSGDGSGKDAETDKKVEDDDKKKHLWNVAYVLDQEAVEFEVIRPTQFLRNCWILWEGSAVLPVSKGLGEP